MISWENWSFHNLFSSLAEAAHSRYSYNQPSIPHDRVATLSWLPVEMANSPSTCLDHFRDTILGVDHTDLKQERKFIHVTHPFCSDVRRSFKRYPYRKTMFDSKPEILKWHNQFGTSGQKNQTISCPHPELDCCLNNELWTAMNAGILTNHLSTKARTCISLLFINAFSF